MTSIALHNMGNEQWTAGFVVQELLLRALRTVPEPRPSLFLTAWKETPETDLAAFRPLVDDVIRLPATDDNARTERLKQRGVNAFISLPTESALGLHVARVVWMYDFQHRHYPENFPAKELARRDRLFKAHADSADRILIYSQAVMSDLAMFAPKAASRARLVRFVPHIPPACWEAPATADVARRYKLPERFFLLPNHFLPHKNHAVVIEALGQLAAQGCRPAVVCTGQDQTPTAERLAARSRELGVEGQFIRLGVVPRDNYFQLLRASAAVLNPSRFEGFGLSAAEAGYMGIPLILSDIPSLKEHGFSETAYFDPDSPEQLAAIILLHLSPRGTRTVATRRNTWLTDQARFGRELLTVFEEALHV